MVIPIKAVKVSFDVVGIYLYLLHSTVYNDPTTGTQAFSVEKGWWDPAYGASGGW